MSALRIEPMRVEDLDEVDLIERASFKTPWPAQTFLDELERPVARVLVARANGRVVGFANYWVVLDEVSLLAIAVHPDHRGRGAATAMMAAMLEEARGAGCRSVLLEVRAGNQPAIALYRRHGFKDSHRRRAYYLDGEDALVMCLALPGAEGACS